MYCLSLNKECKGGQRSCKPDYAVLESLATSTQLLQATLTRAYKVNRYIKLSKKLNNNQIKNSISASGHRKNNSPTHIPHSHLSITPSPPFSKKMQKTTISRQKHFQN